MTKKLLSSSLLLLGFAGAVAALARSPVLPVLNPPVASDYTCRANGNGAICKVDRVFPLEGEPSGIVCGTADNPVELVYYGTDEYFITRYYNRGGYLTRRTVQETIDATIVNPVTGLSANLSQKIMVTDIFGFPSDFSTITSTTTGSAKIVLPSAGVLLLQAGRLLQDADGNVTGSSGPTGFTSYFGGDTAAATSLCQALGTPGTP